MATAQSDAPAFVIEERGGQKRTVRLSGRGLPYRPLTFTVEQRAESDNPNGTSEGVITTLGTKYNDTSCNGYWKDRYMARVGATGVQNPVMPAVINNTPVANIKELVTTLESITEEGQEVDVSWAHITRRGLLHVFTATWHNVHDCEWSMAFLWSSKGTDLGPAAFGDTGGSNDTTSRLADQRNQIASSVQPPFTLPVIPTFVLAMFTAARAVDSSVQSASDATNNLADQAYNPATTSRAVVASCNNVINEATGIVGTIDSHPSRTRVVGMTPDNAQMGTILRAEKYTRTIRGNAQGIKRTSVIAAATIGKTLAPGLLATYRPRTGEDLRDVSRIYYGTSFEWQRLLTYNILDSSLLTVGQTILVPRLENEIKQ